MPKPPPADAYPMGFGRDEVEAVRRELGQSGPRSLSIAACPHCDAYSLYRLIDGSWACMHCSYHCCGNTGYHPMPFSKVGDQLWCDVCGQVVEERES